MRALFAVGALLLTFSAIQGVCSAQSQRGGRTLKRDNNPLVGTWRLVSLEQLAPGGKTQRVDCSGMLIFTSDGHMSVQVMDADPKAGASQYSQGGYEATYGTFNVDDGKHSFIFHVQGALVRTLVGKDLPRSYVLKDGRLIVTSTNPDEHWKVVWARSQK